jgi:integrase
VHDWCTEHVGATIRNAIKPLQAIYRRARSREGLALNPTHDLELPAADPTEVEIVASEVAPQLLDALPAEDRALWATALYAGLRYGELRALRWAAVDLASGTVRVVESWDPKEGTIMIAAGVNPKALSSFMGHSSINVTFDLYGHLMPGTEAQAAALLDTYLGSEVEAGEQTAREAEPQA